ncbi:MAG: hypothetical protein M3Q10_13210 [Chloroflexota bacterium]|nr:hypothetical protein [Chloroflexota bacterium]
MAHQIDRLAIDGERRMHRVWLEDGLDELMGAAWVLTAAAAMIATRVHFLFWFAFMLLPLFGLPHALRLYYGLKARVADPRVGYVRPRPSAYVRWVATLSRRAAMLVFVGASAAWMAVFNLIPSLLGVDAGPLIGWLWGAASTALPAYTAWRTGLRRFYLYALPPPVAQVVGRLAGLDDLQRFTAHLAALGVLAAVSGGLALRAYLRAHPLPAAQ